MGGKLPIGARKLIEFVTVREDNSCDLDITKNRQLFGFLEQTTSSLGESYLSITLVFDSLDFYLLSPHLLFFNVNPSSPATLFPILTVDNIVYIHKL